MEARRCARPAQRPTTRQRSGRDCEPRPAASRVRSGAEAYERGRPSYPARRSRRRPRARARARQRVLDLAAGTGKLTRLLVPTGAEVVAVEPVAGMRTKFAAAVPDVECSTGRPRRSRCPTTRSTPSSSAQAFHWFDRASARRDRPGAAAAAADWPSSGTTRRIGALGRGHVADHPLEPRPQPSSTTGFGLDGAFTKSAVARYVQSAVARRAARSRARRSATSLRWTSASGRRAGQVSSSSSGGSPSRSRCLTSPKSFEPAA